MPRDIAQALFGSTDAWADERPDRLRRRINHAWWRRQAADYSALAAALPELLRQSRALLSRATTEREVVLAARATVHTSNLASSFLKRVGDFGLAMVAADRAVEAARTVDDPLLHAAASHRLANVLLPAGRLDECRSVALAAADVVRPGLRSSAAATALWGALLLTAAVAVARQHRIPEAWELMGEAQSAAYLVGRDHADLFAVFGPTNVSIHAVQVAVELGDHTDAVVRSSRVDLTRLPPELVERRGQYLVDLAVAHLLGRQLASSFAALREAESVAPEEVRLNPAAANCLSDLMRTSTTQPSPAMRGMAVRLGLR